MAKLYPCALSGLVAMVGLAGSAGGGSLEHHHLPRAHGRRREDPRRIRRPPRLRAV